MTEQVEAPGDPALRLRAAVLALRDPQVALRAPAPRSSVFGRAAAAVPDDAHPPADRTVLAARLRSVDTRSRRSWPAAASSWSRAARRSSSSGPTCHAP